MFLHADSRNAAIGRRKEQAGGVLLTIEYITCIFKLQVMLGSPLITRTLFIKCYLFTAVFVVFGECKSVEVGSTSLLFSILHTLVSLVQGSQQTKQINKKK